MKFHLAEIVFFAAIFTFQYTARSAEPEGLGKLSYIVSKYDYLSKQSNPEDGEASDQDSLHDFVTSARYRATFVRFIIEVTEVERKLLQELRMSVSRFDERDKERSEKFPGLTISREIPEGGAAGGLFAEDDEGEWVWVCDITKHGNPVSGFNLIKLSDPNQEILKKLMLRFLLSSEIEIEQRPSVSFFEKIIE